jgi:hypothetical protein
MSVVCPACGVAVVPGYVRCPKCHAGLPVGRSKRTTVEPGGTTVVEKGFPISSLLAAVGVALVIILVFGLRSVRTKREVAAAPPIEPIEAVAVARPARAVVAAPVTPTPAPVVTDPAVGDPSAAAAALEDVLRRQRLWGRVQISGPRVDVRSGSCGDPGMRPSIEGAKLVLRGAGLTKLRCLEQSGAVVFERDL